MLVRLPKSREQKGNLTSKSDLAGPDMASRLVREYVHPQRWRMLAALLHGGLIGLHDRSPGP
jgi:hypothetical protein